MTEEAGLDVQLQSSSGGSNGGMAAGDFNDNGWREMLGGLSGKAD